jgi:cytochrome c-type biogenesis protein CcmH
MLRASSPTWCIPSPLVGEGQGGEPAGACRFRACGMRHTAALVTWLRIAVVIVVASLSPANAVEPDEVLKDPALEARARRISQELRCLVCQNQSIDDSNAPLARDLRVVVRERLAAGDTDGQVLAFVERRYGEFVLLRPPLKTHTIVLWLTPLLLLAGAACFIIAHLRRREHASTGATPLSEAEQKQLEALIGAKDRERP